MPTEREKKLRAILRRVAASSRFADEDDEMEGVVDRGTAAVLALVSPVAADDWTRMMATLGAVVVRLAKAQCDNGFEDAVTVEFTSDADLATLDAAVDFPAVAADAGEELTAGQKYVVEGLQRMFEEPRHRAKLLLDAARMIQSLATELSRLRALVGAEGGAEQINPSEMTCCHGWHRGHILSVYRGENQCFDACPYCGGKCCDVRASASPDSP